MVEAVENPPRDYRIRMCGMEDIPAVASINLATLPENYSREFYVDLLLQFPEGFLVAQVDGRVVGYIMCRLEWGLSLRRLKPTRRGHIVSVAVLPEQRNRGIGTALLRGALEAMRRRGCEEAYLEVRVGNTGAIRLYERLGFRITRRIPGYYRDGEDAYELTCPLTPD